MNRVDIGVGSLELLCYDLLTEWTSVAWFSSNRYEANALKNEWGEETHGEAEILMGKTSLFDMFRRANSDWVTIFCTYEHKSFQPHWLPASILSEKKKKKELTLLPPQKNRWWMFKIVKHQRPLGYALSNFNFRGMLLSRREFSMETFQVQGVSCLQDTHNSWLWTDLLSTNYQKTPKRPGHLTVGKLQGPFDVHS